MANNKILFSIFVMVCLSATSLLAQEIKRRGPSGTGGGDPAEGEFVAEALKLAKKFPGLGSPFAEIAGKFRVAVDSTEVICAGGNMLQKLIAEHQLAYYDGNKKVISLHCERWGQEKLSSGAVITIVHEYTRALTLEGKKYEYSKHIIPALENMGKALPQYGSFIDYSALKQKFAEAGNQKIDDRYTLGAQSKFSCSVVKYDNKTEVRTFEFYKKSLAGHYRHYQNLATCDIVACIAYEEQPFILKGNGELESNGPHESASVLSSRRFDDVKFIFRQTPEGNLIGAELRNLFKNFGFSNEPYGRLEAMLYCSRESLKLF